MICKDGATAGVDVRGGAPGTRETDLLNPVNMVQKIHAVMLAGGSAFGLDAAAGVTHVPIVCSSVLFDLTFGDFKIRPDKEMGYLVRSPHCRVYQRTPSRTTFISFGVRKAGLFLLSARAMVFSMSAAVIPK